MRDPGEIVTKTLVREFCEEALNYNLEFGKDNEILNQSKTNDSQNLESTIADFFHNGIEVKLRIRLFRCQLFF
jgi:hypothetical protein